MELITNIFLSGGMRTNWQEAVISKFLGISIDNGDAYLEFANPLERDCEGYDQILDWNVKNIKEATFVFAYLEATNPKPEGLIANIGMAVALDIPVILVIDEGVELSPMLMATPAKIFTKLDDAVEFCYWNFI